jgi:hypothetical protein
MAESDGGSSQGKSGKSSVAASTDGGAWKPVAKGFKPRSQGLIQSARPQILRSHVRRQQPLEVYRVDGIARRGLIRHVKFVGRPGDWCVYGVDGLKAQVPGRTIEEAVRRARRRIGFHPLTIRRVEADGSFGQPVSVSLPQPRNTR